MYVYAILSTYWKFNVNLHNVLLLTMMMRTYKWSGSFSPFSVRLSGICFSLYVGFYCLAWLFKYFGKGKKTASNKQATKLTLDYKAIDENVGDEHYFYYYYLKSNIFFKVQRMKWDEIKCF